MKKVLFGLVLLFVVFISSCAKCNICKTETTEENICTNSVLDRTKAKSNCKKAGGEWMQIEKI